METDQTSPTPETTVSPIAPVTPTRLSFIKADSPKKFTGKKDEDVQDWCWSMEQYFLASVFGGPFPEELKVPTAANRLDGVARTWWKNLLSTAAPAGVATCTWDQFKILITNRFQSANKEKNARDALTKHSQAGKYLKYDEYLERFMELSLELPQMSVFEKNHAFVTGLKPRTQEFLYAASNYLFTTSLLQRPKAPPLPSLHALVMVSREESVRLSNAWERDIIVRRTHAKEEAEAERRSRGTGCMIAEQSPYSIQFGWPRRAC